MFNTNTEILDALNNNSFEFDGQMWFAHEGGEILVAEELRREGETEVRVVFADSDGMPYATVGAEDAPSLLGQVTTQDKLTWLQQYGKAAGYDVEAC